jgi:two-component system, OmpR family, response regulator
MPPLPHLLLVDDDEDILSLLTAFFTKHGCSTSVAPDGAGMFAALEEKSIDLVILDVMLRDEDGFDLCRQLRTTSDIPVVMLTAMSDHKDRVAGLELGADDYLTKPFDQRELLARGRAVLRRRADRVGPPPPREARPFLYFSGWRLDISRRELRSANNELVLLTSTEFDLLSAMAERSQRILTREQLIDLVYGPNHAANDRSIDMQISRIRYKLEANPDNPTIICTVRNLGYVFVAAVERR